MKNSRKHKSHVTTLSNAEKGINYLNESGKDSLLFGIILVLKLLDKPILIDIINDYPDLISEHGFRDLYENKIEYKNATSEEFEIGILLSMLSALMMMTFPQLDKGTLIRVGKRKIKIEDNDIQMIAIEEITDIISLTDFIDKLWEIVNPLIDIVDHTIIMSVFTDKTIKNSKKDALFDNDPKMKQTKDISMWLLGTRFFLENLYFILEANSKRKK